MILSKQNIEKLQNKGLELMFSKGEISFIKRKNIEGNYIPEWRNNPSEEVECPVIELTINNNKFIIDLWEWTPGPGPGDFNLEFDNESEAVNFIESYYFGENKYFEVRKIHENLVRDSFNMAEIELILQKLLSKLSKEFGTKEISYGERGWFHKIPLDEWRQTKYYDEHHQINATNGFLQTEVIKLRKKIQANEAFDYEDVNFISDLLVEISIKLKNKTHEKSLDR